MSETYINAVIFDPKRYFGNIMKHHHNQFYFKARFPRIAFPCNKIKPMKQKMTTSVQGIKYL